MCRTVAYRHSCSHSTLHTVRRCRFTFAAGVNKSPLCSGVRTPSTEAVRLPTACLACEYSTFTSTWNKRISAARDRLDAARQSLRELDRKTQCAIVSDYDDDWTCCEDIEFADEPSLSEMEWSSSSSNSSSNLSDCSDDYDEPELEDEDADWFSFGSANTTDVRSTSAWEAHNMISSGSDTPKRSSRALALRARLAAQETAALQKLEATRDDYERERIEVWGGYLKSTAKSRADGVRVIQPRNCGPSPLRQVENVIEPLQTSPPSPPSPPTVTTPPAAAALQPAADPLPMPSPLSLTDELPRRRKTEPSVPRITQDRLSYPSWVDVGSAHVDLSSKVTRRHTLPHKPDLQLGGIMRSCSSEEMWSVTGQPRIWSLDDGDDSTGIALPDYGF